jgi:hypothetical protein
MGVVRSTKLTVLAALLLVLFALPVGTAGAATWVATQLPAQQQSAGGGSDEVPLNGVSCADKSLCLTVGPFDTLAWSTAPTAGAAAWHVTNPPYPEEPGQDCAPGPHAGPEECHLYGRLQSVSCATPSLCVVVSHEGIIGASTDPTGGPSAWTSTDPKREGTGQTHLVGVSCPLESLCVAVSGGASLTDPVNGKILTSTEPAAGHWKLTQLSGSLEFTAVSCGTPTLCVATARGGRLVVSTDPTGGPGAWREVDPGGAAGDLGGVGCYGDTFCAVGNATGTVFISSEAGGSAGWSGAKVGGSVPITDVDCPRLDGCVAVDDNGDVSTSVDLEGGAQSWHFENLSPFHQTTLEETVRNALFGVSCPSASLCVLVGANSEIFTSVEPFATTATGAAGPGSSSGSKGRRVVKRPKTFLLLAEGFYFKTFSRHHVRARFHFYAKSAVRGFECSRDGGRWRRCRSPLRYWVGRGHHTLRVRAIGPTGLRGPAAIRHFAVASPRRIQRG